MCFFKLKDVLDKHTSATYNKEIDAYKTTGELYIQHTLNQAYNIP